MNLQPLFETQAKLDKRIVEKKGLQGQDLLDKKILALQVELGELANEHRGFKFWSENQEPRTYGFDDDKDCEYCNGTGTVRGHPSDTGYSCPDCEGSGFMHYNPLLEEYVDCLHFILSIGNDLGIAYEVVDIRDYTEHTTTFVFSGLFFQISNLEEDLYNHREYKLESDYGMIFQVFLALGKKLGFTWEQIEESYFAKNKINHERQANGY